MTVVLRWHSFILWKCTTGVSAQLALDCCGITLLWAYSTFFCVCCERFEVSTWTDNSFYRHFLFCLSSVLAHLHCLTCLGRRKKKRIFSEQPWLLCIFQWHCMLTRTYPWFGVYTCAFSFTVEGFHCAGCSVVFCCWGLVEWKWWTAHGMVRPLPREFASQKHLPNETSYFGVPLSTFVCATRII